MNIESFREFDDFVSPYLCQQLVNTGRINLQTIFKWMISADLREASLKCYALDPEGTYQQADLNLMAISQYQYLPAFTISSFIDKLPRFTINKSFIGQSPDFKVSLPDYCIVEGDRRLPDALAKLWIAYNSKYKYNVHLNSIYGQNISHD